MGPSKEALELAQKLLANCPDGRERLTDLAYALDRYGAKWVEENIGPLPSVTSTR